MTTRRIANPIAVRRFSVAGKPGHEVVLTIGKPRSDPRRAGGSMCSVLIEGIPRERRRRIRGVDAIQALQLALEYARRKRDASGIDITWLDPHMPGDIGLPLSVPWSWGLPFQRRLEHYIEQQTLEIMSAVTAVLQERSRRRAAKDPDKRHRKP
jgi:hypothetical protein